MDGLRYQVISWERKGRIWFHVVDAWAPLSEQPAVEYSFLTRAASDNAARELNRTWIASRERRAESREFEPN